MAKFKKTVQSQLDLVNLENEVIENWRDNNIFQKVNKKGNESLEWIYYDGPITANGLPHYGHVITWTMKDILPRYYTMKGFYVSRNIGWDCQGIPVEYEVEKTLSFTNKSDIEKYGIDKFNQACKDSVLKFRKAMLEYEERLGRWIDHSDEYSTMDPNYIESVWWSLKTLYEKGLLYEGYKVVAYSTRAGMTLSAHEVAEGGYEEVIDHAVTVKFAKKSEESTYFLAWTTTPWTLPGNLMLAVGKNVEYVKIKYNGAFYILARSALKKVFSDCITLGNKYEIVERLKAADLVGSSYDPLFPYYKDKAKDGAFKVIIANHVSTEEGTGIVHLAPYGMEDFDILMDMEITVFDYLDETGVFTEEIPEYKGMFYKSANKKIIEDLGEAIFKHEEYPHQMPMCYRTKTPLIYKPIKSWYVAINKFKDQLINESRKINFVPNLGKERFQRWIENARDWSLSRKRYWGTPMPIWVNDKSGEVQFIGSFKELEELSGKKLGLNFDPHKPFVDEITWKDAKGGTFRRVAEVVDVWYDSGSMPFAQYHYPFENKNLFEKRYPAEYISEGDDQIRLWFYTMFVLGIALFDKSPYKNAIVIGMLCDENGKKMSKSKGNYPPIEEVFNKYGSDMFRYFLLRSQVARGEASSFSYKLLEETKKDFFSIFWNSYRYFVTYAGMYEFDQADWKNTGSAMDEWILARLQQTIKTVRNYLDKYEVMYATRELSPFVNDLSTWYIRRSRERLSSGDSVSLSVLCKVLTDFSLLIAPFMPFISDSIYTNLLSGAVSVHLEDYPNYDDEFINLNKSLLDDMEKARKICSLGNSIRKEIRIPIRQPLSEIRVTPVKGLPPKMLDIICDELNVKKVTFVNELPEGSNWYGKRGDGIGVCLNTTITEDLIVEGHSRELIREIQKHRKLANVEWSAKVKVQYPQSVEFDRAVKVHGDEIKKKTLAVELVAGDEFVIM